MVAIRSEEPQILGLGGEATGAEHGLQRPVAGAARSAAFFGPMPRAPGSLSDGSPRSAIRSGTCSGSTP